MAIKFTELLSGRALARANRLGNRVQDAYDLSSKEVSRMDNSFLYSNRLIPNSVKRGLGFNPAVKGKHTINENQLRRLDGVRNEVQRATREAQIGTGLVASGALGTAGFKVLGNNKRNEQRDKDFYVKGQKHLVKSMLHDPRVDINTKLNLLQSTGQIKLASVKPKAWEIASALVGGASLAGAGAVIQNPKVENNFTNISKGALIGAGTGAVLGGTTYGLRHMGVKSKDLLDLIKRNPSI